MSDFKIGDTVRCIETWTTHVVESGREYTVDDVYPPQGTILVNDQWVPVGYFELVAAGDRATLAARIRRVEAQVEEWERIAAQPGYSSMRDWASVHAVQMRAALADPS